MKRIDIGEAILTYGESLVEEYVGALRKVMRDPKAELSSQEREDWGESVDAFRRLNGGEQMIVLRSAELQLKRAKLRRAQRQSH
jgi:hypothetical protein